MNEKREPTPKVPPEIIDKISQWRQANPQAALTEIEEAVEAELAQWRKELVEELVQEDVEAKAEPACTECGQKMVKNGQRKRKLKGKEGETLELKRQQWRCLGYGTTLFSPG